MEKVADGTEERCCWLQRAQGAAAAGLAGLRRPGSGRDGPCAARHSARMRLAKLTASHTQPAMRLVCTSHCSSPRSSRLGRIAARCAAHRLLAQWLAAQLACSERAAASLAANASRAAARSIAHRWAMLRVAAQLLSWLCCGSPHSLCPGRIAARRTA